MTHDGRHHRLGRRTVLRMAVAAVPAVLVPGVLQAASAQARKRPHAATPGPGTLMLGSKASVSGDGLALSVTAVASSTGGTFTSLRLDVNGRLVALSPAAFAATGTQVFTLHASPLSVHGSFTAFVTGAYSDNSGAPLIPIDSDATKITVVPPQATRH